MCLASTHVSIELDLTIVRFDKVNGRQQQIQQAVFVTHMFHWTSTTVYALAALLSACGL